MSKAPVDPDFAFDPTDQSKSQDFEFMARIRRERPILRPTANVVLTTRYEDTALAFRDSKTFSAVGDMRAPGVVVPLEESFMGELAAEDWTRDRVRKRVAALADRLAAREEADLMTEFAMIRELEQAGDAAPEGLLTVMVQARDEDGRVISAQHARTLVVNMLAGSLSASFMLGNLLYRLLTDPEFDATLRREPDRIPAAVDESFRLEAPVTFLFRRVRHDTKIGGCPIMAGEQVMLGMAAANRDESVYPDADQFRLDRETPKAHLAFGIGPHVWLGNHLTRMIGRVVLEELLARFEPGRLRLVTGFQWRCVDHIQEYGPEALPVRIG